MSMKGTVYAQKFNSGVVSEPEKWYHRWCKDFKHRLKLGKGKKLEMARDQCRTMTQSGCGRTTIPLTFSANQFSSSPSTCGGFGASMRQRQPQTCHRGAGVMQAVSDRRRFSGGLGGMLVKCLLTKRHSELQSLAGPIWQHRAAGSTLSSISV
eukprot:3132552-Rhodomonas_salina.1